MRLAFFSCLFFTLGAQKQSCKLKQQVSRQACVYGQNYGCFPQNNSMWVDDECRGDFTCGSVEKMYCAGKKEAFHVCECSDKPTPKPKPGPTPAPAPPVPPTGTHNILFIIDESTDSRAYFVGEGGQRPDSPVPLPNLARLMKAGTSFNNTYVASPVCCPSRTTIAAGRHAHRIPHTQVKPNTGLHVKGAWNNHEGLDKEYESRFDQILEKVGGYNVKIIGKTDWDAGAHSVDCMVQSWTQKVHFPYTLANHSAGWPDEDGPICSGDDSSENHTHAGDWKFVEAATAFLRGEGKSDPRPWYVHLGTNIVHPSYASSKVWLDKIDESKITIPVWTPLAEMHPEDFQQTMKKHMAMDVPLQDKQYALGGDMDKWKVLVRKHYYAMIAEYDAMVGTVLDAVADSGQWDQTWIWATSDHGDMNMEHRQYYKMTHWDASSRVPLIIKPPAGFAPYSAQTGVVVNSLAHTLDFFPTILDMANVTATLKRTPAPAPAPAPADAPNGTSAWDALGLDGTSLMGKLAGTDGRDPAYPECVMTQFHGEEIHLSWFMVRCGDMKYVTYGSGTEVPARLFNVTRDGDELDDLVSTSFHLPLYDAAPGDLDSRAPLHSLNSLDSGSLDDLLDSDSSEGQSQSQSPHKTYGELASELDAKLRALIDYPAVAADVEAYNKDSFVLWRATFAKEADYKKEMAKLRWTNWGYNVSGNYAEIERWLKTPNTTFEWAAKSFEEYGL